MSKAITNCLLTTVLILQSGPGCDAQTNSPAKKPPSTQSLQETASQLVAQGKYAEALPQMSQLVVREPDNARLRLELADTQFMAGQIEAAIASYDQVGKLEPAAKPHLWQRGLALYYAGEFELGKQQFETHQTVNSADVENSVWHLLCAAQLTDVESARKKMINIAGDTRVPMAEVFKLFAGTSSPDEVLARVQKNKTAISTTNKKQEYYARLYIGLYHEMLGDSEKANQSMKLARDLDSFEHGILMGQIARLHLKIREVEAAKSK